MRDELDARCCSSAPLINLFDAYRGRIFDLDRGEQTCADTLKLIRDHLVVAMQGSGVQPTDRVLIALANGPLFLPAMIAVLALGCAPILVHAASTITELHKDVATWEAQWVLRETSPVSPGEITWTECGPIVIARTGVQPSQDLPIAPLHPTSGTTGSPKLAIRPAHAAIAEAEHYATAMRIGPADCIVCTTPMSHAYAFGMAVITPLLTQANVMTMQSFNPRMAVSALAGDHATIMAAAPVMLRLMAQARWQRAAKLRIMLTAGAPISGAAMQAFEDRTGILARPLLGTTESGGISVAMESPRPGAVGKPMAGVEVRIAGSAGAIGTEPGRLQVRSASMMAGYWSSGQIDRGVDANGWFETGDLARIGDDGQIELFGREAETINVSGYKILPAEIEGVIASLAEVSDVKVYASRSRNGDVVVAAAVIAAAPIDQAAILTHCGVQLAGFKIPSRITFLREFPRNRSGKIAVNELPGASGFSANGNQV